MKEMNVELMGLKMAAQYQEDVLVGHLEQIEKRVERLLEEIKHARTMINLAERAQYVAYQVLWTLPNMNLDSLIAEAVSLETTKAKIQMLEKNQQAEGQGR